MGEMIGWRDRAYVDSTPQLHVGDSAFEDWFQAQPFATQSGVKQISRDSYAAGMGDPLVIAHATPIAATPAEPMKAVAEPEPMFYGRWHHGNGNLCCGTMRYFRADFDTNPAPDVREGIFDWVCTTMNAALDRWRDQKRAREAIEYGESPSASTSAAQPLTEDVVWDTYREMLRGDPRLANVVTFATAIQRACAEKWGIPLSDGGAAK